MDKFLPDDAPRAKLPLAQLLLARLQPGVPAGAQLRVRPQPPAVVGLRRRRGRARPSAPPLRGPLSGFHFFNVEKAFFATTPTNDRVTNIF